MTLSIVTRCAGTSEIAVAIASSSPGVAVQSAHACTEIFGPVLATRTFHDEDETVRIANDTPHGLAASVRTRDLSFRFFDNYTALKAEWIKF